MEGSGTSALAAAAPHGDLRAAALPEDPFPEALYADAAFPEDPFPEALYAGILFADVSSADGGSSGWGTQRPSLTDRVAAAVALLKADLTADGAGLIDQLRAYENFKCWAAGQQARLSVAFEIRHREEQSAAGTQADPGQASRSPHAAEDPGKKRPREQTMGAAEQIALARGESPHRGGRLLGMSKALVTEMPHTLGALDAGQLNEERAMHVVKETACLTVDDRTAVDEELSADTGTFTGAGTRAVVAAARAAAIRRDPRSVTQRASHAVSERTVSLRPAPDCMTYLTALLPAHQGVAVYAALTRNADALRAGGDPRSSAQIRADSLVERTTGTPGGVSGIELNVVMTDRTLLQGDSEPAKLAGYGVVPAPWARTLVTGQPQGDQALKTWIRRLYTAPGTGDLVGLDSRRRLFPGPLRRFIQIRDDTCRTPYCDAPIRHLDHIIPWHDDGPTSLVNGAGLCEACNHTKELPAGPSTAAPRVQTARNLSKRTQPARGWRPRSAPVPTAGASAVV